ncbi:hypothetical protein WA556_005734 [Blastocystis sp. ATCC 50177/Nand II]
MMIASYQTHERKTIVNDLDLDPSLIEQASSNTVVDVQGKDMVPVSVADSELQAGLDDLYGQISRFTIPFLMEDMPANNQTMVYHQQRVSVLSVPIICSSAAIKDKKYNMWAYGTDYTCFIPEYAKSSSCSIL